MRLEYFEMIDRVESFDPQTQTLIARATVPKTSPVFEGHFEGYPLVPGVLLIETMAQASGFLIMGLNAMGAMPFLASVEKAKLRRFVEPERVLTITARMAHEGSGYCVTGTAITVDGGPICDAQLMFRLMPFPAALESVMRTQAKRIGLELRHAGATP